MRSFLLLLLLSFCYIGQASAQDDCDDYLPCGPLPWDLPDFPVMRSPTPRPGSGAGATATPIPTSVGSGLVQPSPTSIDVGGLNNTLGTLQAMSSATTMPMNIIGTPMPEFEDGIAEITENSTTFFGYAFGLFSINLGVLSPLMTFAFLFFAIVIIVKFTSFILPFLAVVFGLLRKFVELVLEFLPL
jgi:hypothetical protein